MSSNPGVEKWMEQLRKAEKTSMIQDGKRMTHTNFCKLIRDKIFTRLSNLFFFRFFFSKILFFLFVCVHTLLYLSICKQKRKTKSSLFIRGQDRNGRGLQYANGRIIR